jgi:hypothetical protein
MITAMLMMLQASIPVAAPMPTDSAPVDPPTPTKSETCRSRSDEDGEIIVCGRTNNGRYRLKPLTTQYDKPKGPGLGFDLGDGARGNVYAMTTQSPDGKPDKRIMVTVTMPF